MNESLTAPRSIKAYHAVTGLKVKAPVAAGVAEAVGEQDADVRRWHQVVLAWVATGWNPRNVKGMLQHFQEHKIPGDDQGQRGQNGGQSVAHQGDVRSWQEVADGPFGHTVWTGSYADLLAHRAESSGFSATHASESPKEVA